LGGFTGGIALNVSGVPPGATATFTPPVISGGSGSSNLKVVTDVTTPQPQIYNLTVTGTNGILVHSTTVYLGVSSSGGNFTGAVSPAQASVSASAAGSAAFTVTATPISGGAGDLTLSASGMPAGVTASFSSTTIPGSSGSSVLTLSASHGTTPGTYQVFITSSGSGAIHQSSVMLTINP
jgi:hypothetical protein